ncbi:MAG: cyclic nucleotide-binding domain-containing protein [Deltaproteobacteria bacterium]|nr:cyclic nucleotide-binding domain-containing protein [Deltaproteobacteria bacterium]
MISTVEKVLFLKSVDLFSQIPGEDLAQVAGIAQEISFEPGELIIQEGEMGDSLYLLVDGEVLVHRLTKEITRLGQRESFGEMAILDNEPRSASVSSVTDVTCLKVSRDDFYELMSEKIEIAHGIIRVLTHRLRDANAKLSDQPG